MYNDKSMIQTAPGRWDVAAVSGSSVMLLLWVLAGWVFPPSVFAGIITTVAAAFVISLTLQRSRGAPDGLVESKRERVAPNADFDAAAAHELVEKSVLNTHDSVQEVPVASRARPDGLSVGARPGGADNLKLIGGVGPKLEETLNGLGIWHFDQISGLTKRDIMWVDERLRFKGRIERDDWIGQAKILALGGETEFSMKKRKIKEKS